MIVFTRKLDNCVLAVSSTIKFWDNGYPVAVDINTAFVKDTTNIYEDVTIPENIDLSILEKYCYTNEKGFYSNPNYTRRINQDDVEDNAQALLDLGDYVATLEKRIAELERKSNG